MNIFSVKAVVPGVYVSSEWIANKHIVFVYLLSQYRTVSTHITADLTIKNKGSINARNGKSLGSNKAYFAKKKKKS